MKRDEYLSRGAQIYIHIDIETDRDREKERGARKRREERRKEKKRGIRERERKKERERESERGEREREREEREREGSRRAGYGLAGGCVQLHQGRSLIIDHLTISRAIKLTALVMGCLSINNHNGYRSDGLLDC
jgi:hypothetical protein